MGGTDRQAARSWQKRSLLAVVPAVLVLFLKFSHLDPAGRRIVGVSVIVVIAALLLYSRKSEDVLKGMHTREELSVYTSAAKGSVRRGMVWVEYAIAREVSRGTYDGAPPADFRISATMLTQQLLKGTRYYRRGFLYACGLILLVILAISVVSEPEYGWFIGILIDIFVGCVLGIGALINLSVAKRPLGRLGRRIEVASELDAVARWDALLDIAKDHLALDAGAA